MSSPQRSGTNLSGGRPNMSDAANEMLKNPAVVALAAAFGLVMIAAVIATIMGIADDMEKSRQGLHK